MQLHAQRRSTTYQCVYLVAKVVKYLRWSGFKVVLFKPLLRCAHKHSFVMPSKCCRAAFGRHICTFIYLYMPVCAQVCGLPQCWCFCCPHDIYNILGLSISKMSISKQTMLLYGLLTSSTARTHINIVC